jgi:cell division protein FtsW (lipid II flippase)
MTSVVVGAASGMATALAGARWWAVLLMVAVILVSTHAAVIWLVTNSPHPPRRVSTPFITWEALEPEEPPPKSQGTSPPSFLARSVTRMARRRRTPGG